MNRPQEEPLPSLPDLEKSGLAKGLPRDRSLCWYCAKACGGQGCPWADSLIPNPEWLETIDVEGYVVVKDCGAFGFDYDRPFDPMAIRKMIAPGYAGVMKRKTDLNSISVGKLDQRLESYNKLRKKASLPPIKMRVFVKEEGE